MRAIARCSWQHWRSLADAKGAGRVALTPGLRSQLRVLAEGADDEVAECAEGILRDPLSTAG